jgi:hypothetical protein
MSMMRKKGRRGRSTMECPSKTAAAAEDCQKKLAKREQETTKTVEGRRTWESLGERVVTKTTAVVVVIIISSAASAELAMVVIPVKAPAVPLDMVAANLTKQMIKGRSVISCCDSFLPVSLVLAFGLGIGSWELLEASAADVALARPPFQRGDANRKLCGVCFLLLMMHFLT